MDVGSGYGAYDGPLRQMNHDIVGIDIEGTCARDCRTNLPEAEFCQARTEHLPFGAQSFDAALMIEVLEHVETPREALAEILRVLKGDGTLILTVPNRGFPFLTHGFRIGEHRYCNLFGIPLPGGTYLPGILLKHIWLARAYAAGEIRDALEDAGFVVDRIVFLMPAFEGGISNRLPPALVRMLRRFIDIFDFKESSWFGLSIAIQAHKRS